MPFTNDIENGSQRGQGRAGQGLKKHLSPRSMQQIIYGQQKSKAQGTNAQKMPKEKKSKLGHVPPVDRHNCQTMQPLPAPSPSLLILLLNISDNIPAPSQKKKERKHKHNWNGGWKLQWKWNVSTAQRHAPTHPHTRTPPRTHTHSPRIPFLICDALHAAAFHFNLNSIFFWERIFFFFLLFFLCWIWTIGRAQSDNWFERICVFASNNCKLFSLRVPLWVDRPPSARPLLVRLPPLQLYLSRYLPLPHPGGIKLSDSLRASLLGPKKRFAMENNERENLLWQAAAWEIGRELIRSLGKRQENTIVIYRPPQLHIFCE